jgi:phosphorylase kinase alpha/beta subunit
MIETHNKSIREKMKRQYNAEDVENLLALLHAHGTLTLTPLSTGLYPAAQLDPKMAALSGYGDVWVRDNVFVALANEVAGQSNAANTVIRRLAEFYSKYRIRFEAIVEGRADPCLPMNRPHVRFDGVNLIELPTQWPQAQNDALGYFLWLYCRLVRGGRISPDPDLLALFALYFAAIRYWEDEDSGHWEERRKVQASSIGAVLAGLRELRMLLTQSVTSIFRFQGKAVTPNFLDLLIDAGTQALASILPAECVQPDPRKKRRYDAALLFLIFPLEIADDNMSQRIDNDVIHHLSGTCGIRRYLGDSYWTADYKDKVPAAQRTADVSERQDERDALASPGAEAQWCIFDPILSVIAGRRYLRTKDPADLTRQTHHLNRSLGQLTGPDCPQGEMLCPEAYYLEREHYIPNDHVPLLWTQANLWLALLTMKESAASGVMSMP